MNRLSACFVILFAAIGLTDIARSNDDGPARRSNQEVANAIARSQIRACHLEIMSKDRTAKLSGNVATAEAKNQVLTTVADLPDVDTVIDAFVAGPRTAEDVRLL